jgi:hypothetical protein
MCVLQSSLSRPRIFIARCAIAMVFRNTPPFLVFLFEFLVGQVTFSPVTTDFYRTLVALNRRAGCAIKSCALIN